MKSDSGYSYAQLTAVVDICKAAVAAEHGLSLSSLCLLKPRTIRKTTSGKIARAWCKRDFLDGSLQLVQRWDAVRAATRQEDVEDANGLEPEAGEAKASAPPIVSHPVGGAEGGPRIPRFTAAEIRAKDVAEIRKLLQEALLLVSSAGHAQLPSPIDHDKPLSSLGLDSMILVQYKGVVERR